MLNGASTEGISIIIETFAALTCSIVLSFVFSWRMALVSLGCVPLLIFGSFLGAKMHAGLASSNEESYKQANLLAGDAIVNYRTVASLAADQKIVSQYDKYLEGPVK